ncbi:MAG: hypothetical protein ABSG01_14295 [Anaerolineales bacterium]|jgi:hypothetical protein
MNEQKTYIVEITKGEGKQWFSTHLHERFLVIVDMAGSRGVAKYRVVEEPVLIYGIEECISYLTSRYIPADCCTVIED